MALPQLISLKEILEIEGLIMLLNDRRDNTPVEIYSLLTEKLETLLDNVKKLSDGFNAETATDQCKNDTQTVAVAPSDTDESLIAENALEEECADADVNEDVENGATPHAVPTEIAEPMKPNAPVSDHDALSTRLNQTLSDIADSLNKLPDNSPNPSIVKEDADVVKTDTKRDVPFKISLNDKYIFRRELFNFSDEDMREALNIASEMTSAEDLEDYFYNDLCWDPENQIVKDFMSIVTARFK